MLTIRFKGIFRICNVVRKYDHVPRPEAFFFYSGKTWYDKKVPICIFFNSIYIFGEKFPFFGKKFTFARCRADGLILKPNISTKIQSTSWFTSWHLNCFVLLTLVCIQTKTIDLSTSKSTTWHYFRRKIGLKSLLEKFDGCISEIGGLAF